MLSQMKTAANTMIKLKRSNFMKIDRHDQLPFTLQCISIEISRRHDWSTIAKSIRVYLVDHFTSLSY
jgi:hypothetical protein